MTTNRTLWTLALAALLLAPAACAQQGPAPGSDPATYAKDYYTGQAGDAAADPAGYAQSQASAEAAGNQTRTAAYVACWAAYEATGMLTDPVCAPFFTPPERAPRPAPEDNATGEVQDALNATLEGVDALANTTLDALNQTLADPADAPSQLSRIVDAVVGFVTGTAAVVVDTVKGLVGGAVDLVLAIVHGILHGLGLGAQGMGIAGGAVVDALKAVVGGVASAATGLSDLVVAAVQGAAKAVADAGSAVVDGIAGAVQATVSGVGAALSATGKALATAGGAVVDAAVGVAQAVGDAVGSAIDAVAGLFGGGHGSHAAPKGRLPDVGRSLPADDLLGSVRKAVPL